MGNRRDSSEGVISLTFEAFGMRVGIRVPDSTLLERLPPYLPYGWHAASDADLDRRYEVREQPTGSGEQTYDLYRDGTMLLGSGALDEILELLERDIRWLLADGARDWIFVHAGAVGWRGRAVILPGASGAGKSTLVAELVKAGARYYSDEYAVLDSEGQVHPFATPLQLRHGSQTRQERHTVADLGGRAGEEPIPVGLIVSAFFRPGCREELQQLSPAAGVLRLLEHVAARSHPQHVLEVLTRVAAEAPTLVGERDAAGPFVQRLLAMLDARIDGG